MKYLLATCQPPLADRIIFSFVRRRASNNTIIQTIITPAHGHPNPGKVLTP